MDDLLSQLQQYGNFFASTAQISGGLVGLVFVALTFRPDALGVTGGAADAGLRKLARQTFSDFINVMLISLLMLVPYSRAQVAYELIFVGALGLWGAVSLVVSVIRDDQAATRRSHVIKRFGLSITGNLFLLGAGIGVFRNQGHDVSYWFMLFSSVIMLLISGTRTAWLLLMHEADED